MGKTIRKEKTFEGGPGNKPAITNKKKGTGKGIREGRKEMTTPGKGRTTVKNILIGNMNFRIVTRGKTKDVLPTRIKSHVPVIESAVEERSMDLGNGNTYKVDIISVRRVMKDVPRDRIHRRF